MFLLVLAYPGCPGQNPESRKMVVCVCSMDNLVTTTKKGCDGMGMCCEEDNDWAKKCMECEVKGPRLRGRPKRTWRQVVQKDCQPRKLNREEAIDHSRWKKLIKHGLRSG